MLYVCHCWYLPYQNWIQSWWWWWWRWLFYSAFRQRRSLAPKCSLIWSYSGQCKSRAVRIKTMINLPSSKDVIFIAPSWNSLHHGKTMHRIRIRWSCDTVPPTTAIAHRPLRDFPLRTKTGICLLVCSQSELAVDLPTCMKTILMVGGIEVEEGRHGMNVSGKT